MRVNMREAKRQLSRLGELAWRGEKVIITKADKPYLDLTPHRAGEQKRRLGLLKGKIWISPDFDATPAAVIEEFEGR